MKKKLALILSAVMLSVSVMGCGGSKASENKEKTEVNMIIPDGITGIACAKLIKDNKEIDNYDIKYNIEQSSENVVSSVLKGDTDLAIVPSNVSATQYNKTKKYKIAATIGWGSFYLVSDDENNTLDSLKGKEVYNIGKGLTPDIVMKSILKDKGYNPDSDFNFAYVSGVTELAPMVISGKTKYAVLPEPALTQVTAKNNNAKIIMDLNEEWKNINKSEYGYPQSTLIVKEDFYSENKEFVDKLLQKVKESTDFAKEKDEKLPDYSEEAGVSTNKDIILKAMDKANLSYTDIKDCKDEYTNYFKKLYEFNPSTIGGSIPDEDIFLEK